MNSLYPVLILLLLGFILWMRDEMKKAPTKKDDHRPLDPLFPGSMPPCPEYNPEYEEALRNAPKLMEEMGFPKGNAKEIADEIRNLPDMTMPPGVSMPDKDYTKDEEFCKKHPCDFMKPYRLPSGTLTYLCTNEEAWERWGIKDEIFRNQNNGIKEVCARCAGLPCLGQRKENKK